MHLQVVGLLIPDGLDAPQYNHTWTPQVCSGLSSQLWKLWAIVFHTFGVQVEGFGAWARGAYPDYSGPSRTIRAITKGPTRDCWGLLGLVGVPRPLGGGSWEQWIQAAANASAHGRAPS